MTKSAARTPCAPGGRSRRITVGDLRDSSDVDGLDASFNRINPQIAWMLDWLIRYQPRRAAQAIGELSREAGKQLGIDPVVTEQSLRIALHRDGRLEVGR